MNLFGYNPSDDDGKKIFDNLDKFRITNDQWHLGERYDTRYHYIDELIERFSRSEITPPCLYQYLPTGGIAEKIADNQFMMHTTQGHQIVIAKGVHHGHFTDVKCGELDRNRCDCDQCASGESSGVKVVF